MTTLLAYPSGVSAYNTSSTSVRVSWKEPPINQQIRPILGYTIYYSAVQSTGTTVSLSNVTGNITEANISGLSPFTAYNVSISAWTDDGEGPAAGVTVRTAEDSM